MTRKIDLCWFMKDITLTLKARSWLISWTAFYTPEIRNLYPHNSLQGSLYNKCSLHFKYFNLLKNCVETIPHWQKNRILLIIFRGAFLGPQQQTLPIIFTKRNIVTHHFIICTLFWMVCIPWIRDTVTRRMLEKT